MARLVGRAGGVEPPRPAECRLRDTQTELIRRTVDAARGNIAETARQLGISRATVYRRLAPARRR